jgi:hypothetical protein
MTPRLVAADKRDNDPVRAEEIDAMPIPQTQTQSWSEKFSHLAGVVAIFAVLGPPIGWFTIVIGLLFSFFFSPSLYSEPNASGVFFLFWVGFLPSYIFGLIPAVISGLAIGLGRMVLRSFGLFHAIVVGIAIGLLIAWKPSLFLAIFESFPGGRQLGTPGNSIVEQAHTKSLAKYASAAGSLILICLVPTVACWFFTRWQSKLGGG